MSREEPRCSFCGAPRSEVHLMAISPLGATICDECVIESFKVMVRHNGALSRHVAIEGIPQEPQKTTKTDAPDTDAQVVAAITDYIDSHGYSPSMRDVAKAIGLSIGPTKKRLDLMRDRGLITFESGMARTIRVVQR